MDLLSPAGKVYQASTFAGNPISVSAAISSIKTINKIKNKLYSKLERFNLLFSTALDDMATDMKIPHQINLQLLFQDFHLPDDATVSILSILRKQMEKIPKIIFLQNHGLIITSNLKLFSYLMLILKMI